MIPAMWPSRKGKTMKTVKPSVGAREHGREWWTGRTQRISKQWERSEQYYDDMHMSAYIFQTQRLYNTQSDPDVNDGLWVIMMLTDCNEYTIWCGYG